MLFFMNLGWKRWLGVHFNDRLAMLPLRERLSGERFKPRRRRPGIFDAGVVAEIPRGLGVVERRNFRDWFVNFDCGHDRSFCRRRGRWADLFRRGSRCRFLAELGERFSRKEHGDVTLGRACFAGLLFVRARRSVLRWRQLAAEAPVASASTATTSGTAPAETSAAAPATASKIAAGATAVFKSWAVVRNIVVRRRSRRRGLRGNRRRSRAFGNRLFRRRSGNALRFDVDRFERGSRAAFRREHGAALILHLLNFFLDRRDDGIELLKPLEEIRNVQEGVAIEADVHKGRLHAGKHASHTPFVDASD